MSEEAAEYKVSNNRMYLVNARNADRVLLAKYYPDTGWYVFHDNLGTRLNTLFALEDDRSMWGPTDWRIEYDVPTSPADAPSTAL